MYHLWTQQLKKDAGSRQVFTCQQLVFQLFPASLNSGFRAGTDAFIQNPEEIFEQAAVPKTEFVLLRTAESLIRLNDLSTAEVVLKVGHQLFPNSPDLLLTNGNVAKKQGRTAVAAFYYITTKKFAEEKKAMHLVEEAGALLKELNNAR